MKDLNWTRLKSDPSVWQSEGSSAMVLAHVDDLLVVGSQKEVDNLVAELGKSLVLKVGGERGGRGCRGCVGCRR